MELRRQIAIARAWLPLLIVVPLLAGMVTFLLVSSQPEVYQVSAHLLPRQFMPGSTDSANVSMSRLLVQTTNYSFIAKSRDLLSGVSSELGLSAPLEELAKRVDAKVDPETAGLTISGRAGDPAAAEALANAVARAVETTSTATGSDRALMDDLDTVRHRLLQAEAEYERLLALPAPRRTADELALANALAVLRELTTVYDSLNASLSGAQGGLVVVEEAAATAAQKIAPLTGYYTLLAVVAGLLLAGGVASLLEYLDDRIRDADTVRTVTGLSTLGTIGRMKNEKGRSEIYSLATLVYPRSAAAESYRTLRTNIEFSSVDRPLRTLLVTSSVAGEGKTVTAGNLAVAFAQAGRRVVLVDADLRQPGVQDVFDLPNTTGLTTLVRSEEARLDDVAQITEQADLRIVTSGPLPPNPAELLGSNRMRAVFGHLATEADLLVVDSSPLQGITDAAILGSFLDGTLIVIDAGRSRRHAVRQGREALAKAGARVLGAVLNRIPERARSTYYGSYGAQATPEATRPAAGGLGEAPPSARPAHTSRRGRST